MRVTQLQVARMVGLDVSSVNKILNRRKGPVFKQETIDRVFKVARQMGYDFSRETKGSLAGKLDAYKTALKELVPSVLTPEQISAIYHVPAARAREIKEMIYGKRRVATA